MIFLSGLFVLLEYAGRYASSDLHDLAILGATAPLIALVVYLQVKWKSFFLGGLIRIAQALLERLKKIFQLEVGADFRSRRRDGVLEQRPYYDLKLFLLFAGLFSASIIPFHMEFPLVIRTLKECLFYVPYLIIETTLWIILLGVILLDLVILVVLFFHYVFKSPFHNPASHPWGRAVQERINRKRLFMFLMLFCGLGFLEILWGKTGWCWIMLLSAAASFSLAFIPRPNESVTLLIKRPRSGKIQSITIAEWNFSFFTIVQTMGLGLFVLSTGAGLHGDAVPEVTTGIMPCTYHLGRFFGAVTSLATLFYLLAALNFLDIKRLREDPALPRKKTLYYRKGSLPGGLKVEGWNITPVSRPPRRDEADLYYEPDRFLARTSGVPVLIKDLLRVTPPDRPFFLDRTDFITKRRIFYRGLKRLMKICHASRFRSGSGFILIPQCYFIEGLHRDDRNEHMEENRIVGPDFQVLWGLRVRHFLHCVFETMDIDIIYFEDGVRYKDLRGVFEILFELYHARGPRFRVEDYHFTGLTGIRVLIELMRPDIAREYVGEGYPETHFTNLSQARILLVCKDRRGDNDLKPEHKPGIGLDIPAFY